MNDKFKLGQRVVINKAYLSEYNMIGTVIKPTEFLHRDDVVNIQFIAHNKHFHESHVTLISNKTAYPDE